MNGLLTAGIVFCVAVLVTVVASTAALWLGAVQRSQELITQLGEGQPVVPADETDAELIRMVEEFRNEVRQP